MCVGGKGQWVMSLCDFTQCLIAHCITSKCSVLFDIHSSALVLPLLVVKVGLCQLIISSWWLAWGHILKDPLSAATRCSCRSFVEWLMLPCVFLFVEDEVSLHHCLHWCVSSSRDCCIGFSAGLLYFWQQDVVEFSSFWVQLTVY